MPLGYYPGMDDCNDTNQQDKISTSVPPAENGIPTVDSGTPPAEHGISPANHGLLVPPPSADKSKMLPPPTPSTKGKEEEKYGGNIGRHLIDVAKDGSGRGTSTPAEEKAYMIPPAPTETDTSTILPAPTEIDAGTIQPAPTENEAGTTAPAPTKREAGTTPPTHTGNVANTTPEKPTHPKQKDTAKHDRPATPSSESSSSDNDNSTQDEEYVSCFLEWLSLNPNSKRVLDNETKMLAHLKRTTEKNAMLIYP